ncbi:TadE/TadG family type IV pilus assembly protein [Dongia sp.]|uniref:TadE/TadG family type IV pilus assembly protein n=1 Tax=Dongia sp. TaxID=1977262 RepID=UPI0035AE0F24
MKRGHEAGSGMRRLWPAGDTGVAAIEFAFIAPVLILFMVGIFEWGRYMYAYNTLQFGCAQAARWGVFHITGTADAIEDYAKSQMTGLTPANVTATIDADTNTVEVTANMEFEFMTGWVTPLPKLTIAARAKM